MDPAAPALKDSGRLKCLFALLRQMVTLSHEMMDDGRPPTFSKTSTPIEWDAGIASICDAVRDIEILSCGNLIGPPVASKTNIFKKFSRGLGQGDFNHSSVFESDLPRRPTGVETVNLECCSGTSLAPNLCQQLLPSCREYGPDN